MIVLRNVQVCGEMVLEVRFWWEKWVVLVEKWARKTVLSRISQFFRCASRT